MEAFSSRLTFGQMESSPAALQVKRASSRPSEEEQAASWIQPPHSTSTRRDRALPAFERLQQQNPGAGREISYKLESDGQMFAVVSNILVVGIKGVSLCGFSCRYFGRCDPIH